MAEWNDFSTGESTDRFAKRAGNLTVGISAVDDKKSSGSHVTFFHQGIIVEHITVPQSVTRCQVIFRAQSARNELHELMEKVNDQVRANTLNKYLAKRTEEMARLEVSDGTPPPKASLPASYAEQYQDWHSDQADIAEISKILVDGFRRILDPVSPIDVLSGTSEVMNRI